MSAFRTESVLRFPRLGLGELSSVLALPLDDPATVAFLDPVAAILDAVRAGPSHRMIGIEDGGVLVGFFVVHPDRRDAACWWLGWLAISPHCQGHGLGRLALAEAARLLRRMDGCRRLRLVVAPANLPARALYIRSGFRSVGDDADGWHVLEWSLPPGRPPGRSFTRRTATPGRPVRRRDRRGRKKPPAGSVAVRAAGPLHAPPVQ